MQHASRVTVSVVSHRQADLVADLLADIEEVCRGTSLEVILTVNVEELLPFRPGDFEFDLTIIANDLPRGFGANHNAACRRAAGDFFCVLNPDIRLAEDPFPLLENALANTAVGAISPRVLGPNGMPEDHARAFPNASTIIKKIFAGAPTSDGGAPSDAPDWIAGMFMLFRTEVFKQFGGFDERYFLYYEDVDLCARLRAAHYDIRVEKAVSVVHHARRESRRNPRYLRWHMQSLARFLFTRPRSLPPFP